MNPKEASLLPIGFEEEVKEVEIKRNLQEIIGKKLKGTWCLGENKIVITENTVYLVELENLVYTFNELFTLRRARVSFKEALDYFEKGKGNPISCNCGQIMDEHSTISMENIGGEWYINV